jgi:hypothetical protein
MLWKERRSPLSAAPIRLMLLAEAPQRRQHRLDGRHFGAVAAAFPNAARLLLVEWSSLSTCWSDKSGTEKKCLRTSRPKAIMTSLPAAAFKL